MEQEATIQLAEQLLPFIPVVVGLFFSFIFFMVAIRLLLRSDWEAERQSFMTGVVFVFLGCWAAAGMTRLATGVCQMTGLVLVLVTLWHARTLFREWFAGFPLAGQKWTVRGIGEVEIVSTTPEHNPQDPLVEELPLNASVRFRDKDDIEREISVLQFRFKGSLIDPKPKPPGRRY